MGSAAMNSAVSPEAVVISNTRVPQHNKLAIVESGMQSSVQLVSIGLSFNVVSKHVAGAY